jgi:hypothetical protein
MIRAAKVFGTPAVLDDRDVNADMGDREPAPFAGSNGVN